MYSTCIFCRAKLGSNEAIEHFPVGRRIAFDAARGRLWVVCRTCERWNLTPLEERWEAIEECERRFSETRLRVSTGNIGLAKLREGLELVRIGAPLRPEMAAWRYGDQFGRRRRRHIISAGAVGVAVVGLVIVGPVTGIVAGGGSGLLSVLNSAHSMYQQRRVHARITISDWPEPLPIRYKQLREVAVVTTDGGWGLGIPIQESRRAAFAVGPRPISAARLPRAMDSVAILTGDDAMRAAAKLLPAINASGARRSDVASAVDIIGEVAEPAKLFERFATAGVPNTLLQRKPLVSGGHIIQKLPKAMRLALEMATHEESERRALEGELAVLEAEWRQAEEIAGIADDMFVTDAMTDKPTALKRKE